MKKGLVFILGVAVGAVLAIGILYVLGNRSSFDADTQIDGISLFDEPGNTMPLKSFSVFQVLPNGAALANSSEKMNVEYDWQYGEPLVYIMPEEGTAYYDDLVIKIPAGKIVRQVGTFRYATQGQFVKTVPIVKIFDK